MNLWDFNGISEIVQSKDRKVKFSDVAKYHPTSVYSITAETETPLYFQRKVL